MNNLSEEEKQKIAGLASTGGAETIKTLAEEYGVAEEDIRNLMHLFSVTDSETIEDENEEYSLDVSDDFFDAVKYGATFDKLNYNRLTFWSLFGTGVIVLFIVAVMFVHEYTRTSALQAQSERSVFYDIEQLQQNDQAKLNSFGVVDPDEGIYRIPIDSAITIIATD
ncbi:MAG: hypothetical protein WD513_06820 [Balneolaceae bacterium]